MLLWGFSDLAIPGICQTDLPMKPDTVIAQSQSAIQVSQAAHPSQSDSGMNDPDDCWCCCSHVVPSVPVLQFTAVRIEQLHVSFQVQLPRWSSLEFFQPPKA